MSRILYFIIFPFFVLQINAQEIPCPPNGVQTNPVNPVNPVNPFYVNYFDWTAYQYPVNWGNITSMTNPNEVINGDAKDLYGQLDYFPEYGWELVWMNLGIYPNGDKIEHI